MQNWLRKRDGLALASDVTQLAQVALAVAAGGGALFAGLQFLPAAAKPFLGGMAGAGLILLLYWVVNRYRIRQSSRHTDWNPGMWSMERTTTVRVLSPWHIEYHYRHKLRFLANNVECFNLRVGWTGGGKLTPYVLGDGFRYTLEPSPIDNAQMLRVWFDAPRHKGDDDFELRFGLITEADQDQPQQPFYSMTLYESRVPRLAQVHVEFAKEVEVAWARREEFANDTAVWPMHPPEPMPIGTDRTLSWVLPAVRNRRYGIRWHYKVESEQ